MPIPHILEEANVKINDTHLALMLIEQCISSLNSKIDEHNLGFANWCKQTI